MCWTIFLSSALVPLSWWRNFETPLSDGVCLWAAQCTEQLKKQYSGGKTCVHWPSPLLFPQCKLRCQLIPLVFYSRVIPKGKVRIHTLCFQRQQQEQSLPFIGHLLFTRPSPWTTSFHLFSQDPCEVDVIIMLILQNRIQRLRGIKLFLQDYIVSK